MTTTLNNGQGAWVTFCATRAGVEMSNSRGETATMTRDEAAERVGHLLRGGWRVE